MDLRTAVTWLFEGVWPGDGYHTRKINVAIAGGGATLRSYYESDGHPATSGFQPAQGQAVELIASALDGDESARARVIELGEAYHEALENGALVVWFNGDLSEQNLLASHGGNRA